MPFLLARRLRELGAFAIDFNLLASSPIRPWHEAAGIDVAAK
jgi:hypothetical protein